MELAVPAGSEPACRDSWGEVLGPTELENPPVLARAAAAGPGAAGWRSTSASRSRSPRPAGPRASLVVGLDALAARREAAGVEVTWDDAFPGHRRSCAADPSGNRLELLEPL